MKPISLFLLATLAISLTSFRDPFWHAFFSVRNETQHTLLVEIDWKQKDHSSTVNVAIPSHSTRIFYDESNIVMPVPEEVFDEIRVKVQHDGVTEKFCTFNKTNEGKWIEAYETYSIYYSLSVCPSDDQYVTNKMREIIASPR